MRVLLTGAFGFLGGRIAERLAREHEVVLSGRAVPAPLATWAQRFETRCADLIGESDLRALVRGADAVLHLAALDEHEAHGRPLEALAVSAEATRRLVEACRHEAVARFAFASTIHVYGSLTGAALTEDSPTRAAHPYAIAHLAGEGFCRQAFAAGYPCVILRLSNGYGCPVWRAVDRWSLAHNDFCRQAVATGAIRLASPGQQQRDFVWVDDIAQAAARVLAAEPARLGDGVFNVGGDQLLTIRELAQRVQARAELALGRAIAVEWPASDTPAGPPVRFAIDRLRALGFAPSDHLDEETDRILALIASAS